MYLESTLGLTIVGVSGNSKDPLVERVFVSSNPGTPSVCSTPFRGVRISFDDREILLLVPVEWEGPETREEVSSDTSLEGVLVGPSNS